MIFYYQIKGLSKDGSWSWPPIETGLIEAVDSKDARKMVEEKHGCKLPGAKLKNDKDYPFLLTITDATFKPYLTGRFIDRSCKMCGVVYTLNEKYMTSAGGGQDFCNNSCDYQYKLKEGLLFTRENFDFTGIHEPVIYKITNKITGQCYIGKTTQAFTLRWYQHFYQPSSGSKFYTAIKEHGMINWVFEVIEVLDKYTTKDKILERESYWIRHFNSIENGYNSLISKTEEVDTLQIDIF